MQQKLSADNELDLKFKTVHNSEVSSGWFIDFYSDFFRSRQKLLNFLERECEKWNCFHALRSHISLLIACEFGSIMHKVNCIWKSKMV